MIDADGDESTDSSGQSICRMEDTNPQSPLFGFVPEGEVHDASRNHTGLWYPQEETCCKQAGEALNSSDAANHLEVCQQGTFSRARPFARTVPNPTMTAVPSVVEHQCLQAVRTDWEVVLPTHGFHEQI